MTFVFGSDEGFRLRTGTVFTTTVPTVAERSGDFSALGATIYDPLSVNPGCPVSATPCNRTAFPGNIIPNNRINTTSQFLLSFIPLPTNSNPTNNFVKAASTGGNVDEYVGRVDQNINSSNRVFGRFSYWKMLS